MDPVYSKTSEENSCGLEKVGKMDACETPDGECNAWVSVDRRWMNDTDMPYLCQNGMLG